MAVQHHSIRRETSGPVRLPPSNIEALEWHATDNSNTPRFVAMLADDYLEADDQLDTLLALLPEDVDGDIIVWENFAGSTPRVAALVRRDGAVHVFDAPPSGNSQPLAAPSCQPARPYSEALRRMRQCREECRTLQEIADTLNQEGFRTQRGRAWNFVSVSRELRRAVGTNGDHK